MNPANQIRTLNGSLGEAETKCLQLPVSKDEEGGDFSRCWTIGSEAFFSIRMFTALIVLVAAWRLEKVAI
jgi:hypothetical protein